ncbi:MAG TPA: hypothetical protein VGR02_17240 [Thermoanaerobaculia bacterium]|jgi:hypothetical protein|nr:hypothetical protein [Thermoanaerobaculia bacterium]
MPDFVHKYSVRTIAAMAASPAPSSSSESEQQDVEKLKALYKNSFSDAEK